LRDRSSRTVNSRKTGLHSKTYLTKEEKEEGGGDREGGDRGGRGGEGRRRRRGRRKRKKRKEERNESISKCRKPIHL
jgi:hypothetical protein